ncbi:hypothetical protein V7968_28690 [Nocardia vulneris]|uniref:hypothetical protein n=1 Tax=Nocardia vulneris TaxID=1141657 RepID=UPI0030D0B71E
MPQRTARGECTPDICSDRYAAPVPRARPRAAGPLFGPSAPLDICRDRYGATVLTTGP